MGSKKRKRRLFTGETPIGGPSVKSKRAARKITSSFHKIQNEIGSLLTSSMSSTSSAGEERVRVLEQQLEEMGGRKRYQQASVVTTSQHKTSKWVVSVLKKLGLYQNATAKEKTKLRVLEVGAVNIQLQQYSGLSVRAIDINSQHPSIEEKDFFDIIPSAEWDVVVCAMVVNCVDTPTRRAEMLIKLSGHLKPNKGILFLILPTKCIKNEFLSPALFRAFLRAIDLDVPSDDTEYYSKLFPQKTCQEPLDDYCSRSTPKLSFFVLVHREPSRSLEMAKQDDIHPKLCNSNWFINPKFSHIMESVKAAVEEGTIKSFIQTDEADFKCKSESEETQERQELSAMLGRLLAHPRNRSLSSLHGPFLSSWSRSLSSSVTSFPTPPGEVRRQLQALSPKMTERVFFYHEKNPHIGILENIKYHIYNYYSLLGPLKTSWYPILKAHTSLGKILAVFLHRQDSSISYPQSLHSIASLLDSLENKKGVSSCKLEHAVRGGKNLIRFKREALTNKELIVLQTLAKYGYYNYEIV